jgi:hypothetical protein
LQAKRPAWRSGALAGNCKTCQLNEASQSSASNGQTSPIFASNTFFTTWLARTSGSMQKASGKPAKDPVFPKSKAAFQNEILKKPLLINYF